jgi:hypothetical protein
MFLHQRSSGRKQSTGEYALIKNPNRPRNMFTKSCTNVPDTANTPCTLEKMVLRIEVKMPKMDWIKLLIEARMPVMIAVLLLASGEKMG